MTRLERARQVLRGALLALLVVSPLPFGSVGPRSLLVLELWALGLGAVALWVALRDPEFEWPRAALVAVGLIGLVGLVQLIPVPHAVAELLTGPTHVARDALSTTVEEAYADYAPLSLAPPATVDALLRFGAYLFVGLAAAVTMRSGADVRLAAAVLLASAGFQAVYGAAEYLSGHQHIFGYAKEHYLDSATGTFINRNHFAGYLAMVLPLTFVLLASDRETGRRRRRSWRSRLAFLNDPSTLYRLLVGAAGVAIACGILLSYSRGGLFAAVWGVTTLLLLRPGKARWIRTAAITLLIPLALLSWQEIAAPGERFVSNVEDFTTLNSRLPVWEATAQMVPDYSVVGTGFGTFADVFPLFRPESVTARWDHAHNDWLQQMAEGGVLGWIAVAILLVTATRRVLSTRTREADLVTATIAAALVAGLAAAAAHGAIDFSARIPAVALALAFLGGACLGFRGAEPARPGFSVASGPVGGE